MLSLKLIPVLWLAVVMCNLLAKKFTPEISSWYPTYSCVVGVLTTMFLLWNASL